MDYSSNVDTSSPFRSVKEAVSIFGERFLVGGIYTPKPLAFPNHETPFFSPSPKVDKVPHWNYSSPSPRGSSYSQHVTLSEMVKKLETELEETKVELNLLKERESETEVALASLNDELHKSMSKLARAEEARTTRAGSVREGVMKDGAILIREEEKKRDAYLWMESKTSQSLAQILSFGENEHFFVGKKKLVKKKKPIVPLVGDLFWRKKGSSTTMHNPLYASSHTQWN